MVMPLVVVVMLVIVFLQIITLIGCAAHTYEGTGGNVPLLLLRLAREFLRGLGQDANMGLELF